MTPDKNEFIEGFNMSNCAAGPWQPMSTAPQGQKILVKVKLHGAFHVFVAKRHASSWEYFPEDNISYLSMYGKITAWAALNTQEGED